MPSYTILTSVQNPKIKALKALTKPRNRRTEDKFTIEGIREVSLAVESGYDILQLFFCRELVDEERITRWATPEKSIVVSRDVFNHIAVRQNSGGVVAVASTKHHNLQTVSLTNNPIILIVQSVEKPGNLGAILRTADAAAVTAVVVCDTRVDFYNPNTIRASLGSVFTKQLAMSTTSETIAWLQKNNIAIYCTSLAGDIRYDTCDFSHPCAIVLGTEATGVTNEWEQAAHKNIIIPMRGKVDSLNVSNTAAIVIFEACRQRKFR